VGGDRTPLIGGNESVGVIVDVVAAQLASNSLLVAQHGLDGRELPA